jgi:aminopeptidase N
LVIPDTGNFIRGVADITVRRNTDDSSVRINAVDLETDSVYVNGERARFSSDPEGISVVLPRCLPLPCDTVTISVGYHGAIRDGLLFSKDQLGRWTAFGDNWPERARYWLPCVDIPSDKATVEWRIFASPDRRVIANGRLLERSPDSSVSSGHRMLTVWKETSPISTYLMVIAVAPYDEYQLNNELSGDGMDTSGVQQFLFVAPEVLDFLPGPFLYAPDIVDFYSKTIAPFPYEKLAHVQSSTRYGGMENASAIFYANDEFESRLIKPDIIAHETAHQWFGDAVTERAWPHVWLSEGFATYFAELWEEHEFGDSLFTVRMKTMREQVLASRDVQERPVIDTLEREPMVLLNTNSYQKGAWVLHMLRSMVGDSVFFSSIRSYYNNHKDSTVLTDDLESVFEQSVGHSLRWYFDEWLRRPGYPEMKWAWSYSKESGIVTISVRQTGPFPPFRFPLEVDVVAASGKHILQTIIVREEPSSRFALSHVFNERPKEIILDPHCELLGRIVPD